MFNTFFLRPPMRRSVQSLFGLTAVAIATSLIDNNDERISFFKNIITNKIYVHAETEHKQNGDVKVNNMLKIYDHNFQPRRGSPIPSSIATSPTYTIVTDNVESIVLDPLKDVLLDIYSPTCHNCANFGIVIDAVALAFKEAGIDTVVVGKMNGHDNYLPGLLTKAEEGIYPTLKFYPADKTKVEQMKKASKHVLQVQESMKSLMKLTRPLTDDDFTITKLPIPSVGMEVNMSGMQHDYSWNIIVDFIHHNGVLKFDIDAVKRRLEVNTPQIIHSILEKNSNMQTAAQKALMYEPCSQYFDSLTKMLILKTVGATTRSDFEIATTSLQQCLNERREEEIKYWAHVKSIIDDRKKTIAMTD